MKKRCTKCGEDKDVLFFGKDKLRKDGLFPQCRPCRSRTPDQLAEYIRNRDSGLKRCCRCKEWLESERFHNNTANYDDLEYNCKACIKLYRQEERISKPDQARARDKRWRTNNPAYKAWRLQFYQKHRHKMLERSIARSKTPAGKLAQSKANHLRRLRVISAPATLTLHEWERILALQNFTCGKCFSEFGESLRPTMDHIVPVSQGGGLTFENIQALCRSCNSSKGARNTINYRAQFEGTTEEACG